MGMRANERVDLICPVCSKSYSVNPTRLKHGRGTTCSPECSYKARFNKAKERRIESRCLNCGGLISTPPSRYKNKQGIGKYCKRECRDSHWINVNHPGYIGTPHTHKYGKNWSSIRRAILKRDSNTCQMCGVSKPRLHIHHKRPFRLWDNASAANHESNLITLCAKCHRIAESQIGVSNG